MSEDAVASIQVAEIQRFAVLRGTMARPESDDDGPATLVEGPPER